MRSLKRLKIVVTDWIWRPGLSSASGAVDDSVTLCQPKAANNISALDELLPLKCVDTEIDIGTLCREMRPSNGLLRFWEGEVALTPMTYRANRGA